MKLLLLIGGVLFLILGIILMIAAAIFYLVGRKRAAVPAQPYAPPPQQPAARPAPPPPPPVAAPRPQPQSSAPAATVVLDVREMAAFGSLKGISGALEGRTFMVEPNGFYIGRDTAVAQVLIDDPRVSKRHVWIGVRDGAVMAIDESSTNGTYLNSTANRIRETRLSPGDTLIISQDVTRLRYER